MLTRPTVSRDPVRISGQSKWAILVKFSGLTLEYFVQNNLSTEYMHGKLSPSLTTILTGHGALTWVLQADYRFTDSFIGEIKYINVHRFGNTINGIPARRCRAIAIRCGSG